MSKPVLIGVDRVSDDESKSVEVEVDAGGGFTSSYTIYSHEVKKLSDYLGNWWVNNG